MKPLKLQDKERAQNNLANSPGDFESPGELASVKLTKLFCARYLGKIIDLRDSANGLSLSLPLFFPETTQGGIFANCGECGIRTSGDYRCTSPILGKKVRD